MASSSVLLTGKKSSFAFRLSAVQAIMCNSLTGLRRILSEESRYYPKIS